MPDEPNIHEPQWDAEMPDAPFRAKAMPDAVITAIEAGASEEAA
jgi:hypothetical protein